MPFLVWRLPRKGEAGQACDEVGQKGLQLRGGNAARDRRVVANCDPRQDPRKLGGREAGIFAVGERDGILRVEAGALQGEDVHEVAKFGAGEQSTELVCEDLLGRIDAHATEMSFRLRALWRGIDDEVHDHALVLSTDEPPPEIGGGLDMLHRGPDIARRGTQRRLAFIYGRDRGEEVEVGRLPVSEIVPGQGRASRQVEVRLMPEEGRQQIALEGGKSVSGQGGRPVAIGRGGTPRTAGGDPSGGQAPPIALQPRPGW